MAKVNWINGSIEPSETGKYYVISEAVTDYNGLKKGDVIISMDEWLPVLNKWGYYNIHFRILAWAPMIYPDIPKDLQGRVKWYFGKEVRDDGAHIKPELW